MEGLYAGIASIGFCAAILKELNRRGAPSGPYVTPSALRDEAVRFVFVDQAEVPRAFTWFRVRHDAAWVCGLAKYKRMKQICRVSGVVAAY